LKIKLAETTGQRESFFETCRRLTISGYTLELFETVLLKAGGTPLDVMYDPDCLPKNDSS